MSLDVISPSWLADIVPAPPPVVDRVEPLDAVRAGVDRWKAHVEAECQRRVWRDNPAKWARDRLGVVLWSAQIEILDAAVHHRRIAVQSCHGTGKSFSMAVLTAFWIDVHPPGSARVITTAPTGAQVKAILWQEIGQLHERVDLPGRVNQTEWWIDRWMAGIGRKPADYSQSAFQGMHARFVLIVLDEACGIPLQLWTAAESIATNDASRIIAIGNPDDAMSEFAKKCDAGNELWHTIQIGYERLPAYTGERVPEVLQESLTNRLWVEERRQEWGEDNPLFVSKCQGQFPVDAPDKVVRFSDVSRCRIGRDEPHPTAALLPVELGMDIGGGVDDTVIRERRGLKAGRQWDKKTDDPELIAEMLVAAVRTTGARHVKYDSIGIGWSVGAVCARALKDAGIRGVKLSPVNFGEKAKKPEKYKNRRAEVWWEVGRLLSQDGGWDLSGMQDADKTVAQLCDPKWWPDAAGRTVVEDKDAIRKRTGRSPDHADALLYAFCSEGGPAHVSSAEKTGARLPTGRKAGTPVGVRRIGPIPGGGR